MKEEKNITMSGNERVLLWLLLFLWVVLFLIGIFVDSKTYREAFALFNCNINMIETGFKTLVSYTMTNVGALCIISGMLGALGAKATLGYDGSEDEQEERDTKYPLCSAVLRSFLVYLTLISGVLIIGDQPMVTTPDKYVKLAGIMSLTGFIASYKPGIFMSLLEKATNRVNNSKPK